MLTRFTAAMLAAAFAYAPQINAQGYPNKPVTMIVPYPPGGATDIIGRVIAQSLSEKLGQQVVIDNRSGAGGNIGAEAAARAKPDGYTLLMGAMTSHSINATLQKESNRFDLLKDFAPVSIVGTVPLVLVVNPAVRVKTLAEFIALAKAKSGELTMASSGNGSPQHLALEKFQLLTGTKMVHVPYKGSGPAMTDLVGGQITGMIETVPAAINFVKADKLRAIMVTTAKRIEQLPNVPTAKEAGLNDFEVSSMFGVAVPTGTPRAVIDRLNAELAKVLALPEVKAKLLEQGVYAEVTTPEQAAKRLTDEVAKWAKVIKDANVKVE